MSQDDLDIKPATLNPSYLKAVLDEADFRGIDESIVLRGPPVPAAYARHENEFDGHSSQVLSEQTEPRKAEAAIQHDRAEKTAGEDTRLNRETAGYQRQPAGPREAAKAAISSKQAQIERVRQEIDRLSRPKAARNPGDSSSLKATLNELRLKRLAVQMALVSGGEEYGDGDLVALDKQIAELTQSIARDQEPGSNQNEAPEELNARISGLRSELEIMTHELRKLIAGHYMGLVVRKAEDYVKALKAANDLRHELLALAALAPREGPLRNMNLGDELPRPLGFGAFAELRPEDLEITGPRLEEAKARIRKELAL